MDSVRRGEATAFEAVYDRHSSELLSFCVYMLGCRSDAEDALQATFAAAYRALNVDDRPVALRPWLFAIARNQCLTILRRRRPTVELNGEPALRGDPLHELEMREEVHDALVRLRDLPERQRTAMVLAELRGFSQAEIGSVLGVRTEQVKALVYQARADLISDRRARETNCDEIREELSSARGAALLRGRLRRHVRSCEDCRTFADGVARQRRQVAALLPLAPWLILKFRGLQDAFASGFSEPTAYAGGATLGGTVAGAALEFAGGGIKAIAVKVVAGAAMLGLGASVGASVAPNQPLARVASAVSSNGFANHGERGGRSSAARAARIKAERAGRTQFAVVGLGAGSRVSGAGGSRSHSGGGERSPAEHEGGGGSHSGGSAASKPAAHPTKNAVRTKHETSQTTTGGQHGHGSTTALEREEARQAGKEQRQQQHGTREQALEEHALAREEHQQHREESQPGREQRQREGEERQHEGEQRQREHEKGKRVAERQHAVALRQHEREKAKHQREHEHASVHREHLQERNKRVRETQRARKRRERERARKPGRRNIKRNAETPEEEGA